MPIHFPVSISVVAFHIHIQKAKFCQHYSIVGQRFPFLVLFAFVNCEIVCGIFSVPQKESAKKRAENLLGNSTLRKRAAGNISRAYNFFRHKKPNKKSQPKHTKMSSTATATVIGKMDDARSLPLFRDSFSRVQSWIVPSSVIKFDRDSAPIREGLITKEYNGTYLFSEVTVVKFTSEDPNASEALLEELLRETQFLLLTTCDYIVPVQRLCVDNELLLIKQKIKYTLREHFGYYPKLNLNSILKLALPILKGLNYIHSHEIVMGNLNPDSVAIMSDDKPKIATLGYSAHIDEAYIARGAGEKYSAPEVLDSNEDIEAVQKPKADVYSFGCLLSFMLLNNECLMFPEKLREGKEVDYIKYVAKKGYKPFRPTLSSNRMTPTLNTLLDMCLEHSYEKRPYTEELVPVLVKSVYESFSSNHSGMSWWKINFGASESDVCHRVNWNDFAREMGFEKCHEQKPIS